MTYLALFLCVGALFLIGFGLLWGVLAPNTDLSHSALVAGIFMTVIAAICGLTCLFVR